MRPRICNIVVSLFDESGNMVRPWAEAGWQCLCFDILNVSKPDETFTGGGSISYVAADLDDPFWIGFIADLAPSILFSFSPCDDLAVCGAKHFARKLAADPDCQARAVRRARLVETIANAVAAPWMHENPIGILPSLWRPADHWFNPCDYGGWLPDDDIHPRWPAYIPPRDAYNKRTGIRCGNGFVMPPRRPVEPVGQDYPGWRLLGGKSARTKQIRSETPRGFALAVFHANSATLAT